jgi:hypothetical protein
MTSPDEPQESQGEGSARGDRGPRGDRGRRPATWVPVAIRRHWIWIALTAAVALAAFAAVNISGGSGGSAFPASASGPGSPGSPGSGPAAAASTGGTATPNPDATKPVPTAIPSPAKVSTASSAHLPRKLAASLARWKAGRGGAALAGLTLQVTTATQAAGLKLYPMMRTACVQTRSAAAAARAGPPIPDAVMQAHYETALATLTRAAADCRAAISVRPDGDETLKTTVHPRALNVSRSEFGAGAAQLYLATAKISALGRH